MLQTSWNAQHPHPHPHPHPQTQTHAHAHFDQGSGGRNASQRCTAARTRATLRVSSLDVTARSRLSTVTATALLVELAALLTRAQFNDVVVAAAGQRLLESPTPVMAIGYP